MIFYPLENMMNFRDIGLWKTRDNKYLAPYVFLRSDRPKEDSLTMTQFLKEHEVYDVIDLRTNRVIEKYPNPLKEMPFINYHHVPIEEGSTISISEMPVVELYMRMVKHYDDFKKIFTIIGEAPKGVLIHCTAGKDRTGVIIALLLDLLNVDDKMIITDYALSSQIMKFTMPKYQQAHPTFYPFLGESKAEYMEEFIKLFRQEYTSAYQYLLKIGVEKRSLELIYKKAFL